MKSFLMMKSIERLAVFLLPAFFISCKLPVTENQKEVTFTLPEKPPYTNSWRIVVSGENTEKEFVLDEKALSFSLAIPEGKTVSIKAFPKTLINGKEKEFFLPAGTVFPGNNLLSWEGGFAAATENLLVKQGAYEIARYFNWNRLTEEIQKAEEKSVSKIPTGGNYFNPWKTDTEILINEIKNGTFTFSDLKSLERIQKSFKEIFPSGKNIFSPYYPESRFISETGNLFLCTKENITDNFLLETETGIFLETVNYSTEYNQFYTNPFY